MKKSNLATLAITASTKRLSFFICLLILSINVNAAIVDVGNYVQDTATQTDWLKLTETQGLSFDAVTDLINNDSNYAGYQFASRDQVRDLFINYYGSNPLNLGAGTDGLDFNKTYDFVQLIGMTQLVTHNNNDVISTARGYINLPFGANKHYSVAFIAVDYDANRTTLQDEGRYLSIHSTENDDVGNNIYGSFLVRSSTVSAVPEPSSYLMMLSGLLLLAGAFYRNHTQREEFFK